VIGAPKQWGGITTIGNLRVEERRLSEENVLDPHPGHFLRNSPARNQGKRIVRRASVSTTTCQVYLEYSR
jgi:hypothetical protein